MGLQIVITKHFEKHYLKRGVVTRETIGEKAREIENNIFYAGEGRVAGSGILYKKRFRLKGGSKRRGGRLLIVLFQKNGSTYVPHSAKKEAEKIIQETIAFMSQ